MRPVIFESKNTDILAFEKNMSQLYCMIIYLSLAQSVAMTVFAPLIVNILYGAAYQDAIGILRVLVWYTTFSYIGSVRNIWILAEHKQRFLWIINLSGATTNVILNTLLIPRMAGVGAALASLLTQFFTNVIIGYIIRPISYNNKLMLRGASPLCAIETLKVLLKR